MDRVRVEGGEVGREVAGGQDASVEPRVEGLDPTVQHLGESGDVCDLSNGHALVPEELGSAAGRENLDAERGQGLRECDDAGLVVNADQGPTDLHRMMTLRPTISRRPSANRRTACG